MVTDAVRRQVPLASSMEASVFAMMATGEGSIIVVRSG
jgi:hypothetical protein